MRASAASSRVRICWAVFLSSKAPIHRPSTYRLFDEFSISLSNQSWRVVRGVHFCFVRLAFIRCEGRNCLSKLAGESFRVAHEELVSLLQFPPDLWGG